jgi:hypothetical protein
MTIKKKPAPKKKPTRKKVSVREITPQQEAKSESTRAKRLAELAEESTILARLVARNPSAPSDLLKWLGSHNDSTVRKWVTSHPGTPPAVLVKLATQFPEQFLENPALDILLLENPNLLNELPIGARRSLVKREKCPTTFMEWLADDEDEGVQLSLAMNPTTPRFILDRLEKSQSSRVQSAAKQHVRKRGTRARRQSDLAQLSKALAAECPDDRLQEKLRLLAPWTVALSGDDDPMRQSLVDWVRWRLKAEGLAQETRTPPSILAKLGGDPSWLVRRWVGGNPSADSATLHQLACDANAKVRMHVASNPSTPPEVLDLLAKDRVLDVRKLVAVNSSSCVHTIRRLAESSDFGILDAIAMHPETPLDVLLNLLRRSSNEDRWQDQSIREEIAKRRKLPPDVLAVLCGDSAESVRKMARNNRSTPRAFRVEQDHASGADPVLLQYLAKSRLLDTRMRVASNPLTPVSVLTSLAHGKGADPEVLVALAKNPSTPVDLLEKLGRSRNADVRVAVAANSAIPASMLEALVRRWPHDARLVAAGRSDLPLSVVSLLARRALAGSWNRFTVKAHEAIKEATALAGNIATPPTMLESFYLASTKFLESIHSPHPCRTWSGPSCGNLVFAIAANPQAPPRVLALLAKQPGLEMDVAENPGTPIDVLSALAEDLSAQVRRAAIKNLETRKRGQRKPQNRPQKVNARRNPAPTRPITDVDRLLAGLPGLAHEFGNQLAAHDRIAVRRQLATNPALTEEVAVCLAQDSSRSVRTALAQNPSVPRCVLKTLMADTDSKVSTIAEERLSNPASDPNILQMDRRMANKALQRESNWRRRRLRQEGIWRSQKTSDSDRWTERLMKLEGLGGPPDEKLKELVKGFADDVGRSSRPRFQRLMCLLMAQCPTSLLAKSARSTDWKERLAIASHPKTPPAIRKQLANDGNGFVRAAAGAPMATVAKP